MLSALTSPSLLLAAPSTDTAARGTSRSWRSPARPFTARRAHSPHAHTTPPLALATPRAPDLPPCLAHQPHGRRTRTAALLGGGLRCALHVCLRPLPDRRVLRRALPARALARAHAAMQGAGGCGRCRRGGCRGGCFCCCYASSGRGQRWRGQAARRLQRPGVPRAGLPLRAGWLRRCTGAQWRSQCCVLWVPFSGVLQRGVPDGALGGAHGGLLRGRPHAGMPLRRAPG